MLLLARSPLADSQLVLPALVRDDLSPTAQERGQALRLVLRWAVERLAPATPRHPLGEHRPLDDPTWQDPAWWRYNILRHRYLEPLHPDDFVDGGRYTETLLAFTGIPTRDLFYEERSRAIREVAQWLRTQAAGDEATHLLRQLALDEVYAGVRHDAAALHMLTAAATFNDVIPQALLTTLAADEGVREPVAAIERLVAAAICWRATMPRCGCRRCYAALYQRETPERRRVRHHRIGAYYRAEGDTLRAVYHLQQARTTRPRRRCCWPTPGISSTRPTATNWPPPWPVSIVAITPRQWCRLQVLLADVYRIPQPA
ncbi:MAG: hypothetical protein R2851_10605 [Caldilineaceae bacterium]